MNREQFKHLQGRLDSAARTLRNRYQKFTKPAAVKRAEAVVARWEKQCDAAHDAHVKKVDAQTRAAREALYFDDPTKALAAVKKIEAAASA